MQPMKTIPIGPFTLFQLESPQSGKTGFANYGVIGLYGKNITLRGSTNSKSVLNFYLTLGIRGLWVAHVCSRLLIFPL